MNWDRIDTALVVAYIILVFALLIWPEPFG